MSTGLQCMHQRAWWWSKCPVGSLWADDISFGHEQHGTISLWVFSNRFAGRAAWAPTNRFKAPTSNGPIRNSIYVERWKLPGFKGMKASKFKVNYYGTLWTAKCAAYFWAIIASSMAWSVFGQSSNNLKRVSYGACHKSCLPSFSSKDSRTPPLLRQCLRPDWYSANPEQFHLMAM